MAKFIYLYKGSTPNETPEAQEASMQAWMGWLNGLGSALTAMGDPFLRGVAVTADGTTTDIGGDGAGGWSAVEADSLERAEALTAGCPVFADGGTVEVYEAAVM